MKQIICAISAGFGLAALCFAAWLLVGFAGASIGSTDSWTMSTKPVAVWLGGFFK